MAIPSGSGTGVAPTARTRTGWWCWRNRPAASRSLPLNLGQNLDDDDDRYAMLSDSHQDLDEAQSKILSGQLILLLSNHIGDLAVLRQAFALARVHVERTLPR